jgi:hypothetical protein
MLVADSTKLRRSAPVRIAHLSQIQTFVTDAPLPAGLASICSHRGIEVVEAMEKPAADIDEPRRRNGCDGGAAEVARDYPSEPSSDLVFRNSRHLARPGQTTREACAWGENAWCKFSTSACIPG